MTDTPLPEPAGSDPSPSDDERRLVIDRIQQALAEERITFEELDDRFEAVFAATTSTELERVAADLPVLEQPPPPPTARHPAPRLRFSLLGDVKIGGWLSVGEELRIINLIGDATVDLSSANIGPVGVTITAVSLIGDVKVIVPDGARVQFEAISLIGDNRQELTEPVGGGPLVKVQGLNVIGDVSVYSLSLLPPGKLRRLWSALRRTTP